MAAQRLSAVYAGVLLLCFSTLGWAQSNSGVITGTVVDSTGAVAPGVSVTVTDLQRGVKSSTKSNDAGVFAVPALTVGDYRVEAEKQGFKKFVQQPVTVHTGSTTTVNITIEVGQLADQVSVTGSAPLLNTTDAQVSTVMTNQMYLNLPLSLNSSPTYGSGRRQPSQFILTVNGANSGVENDTVGKMFNGNQYYQGMSLIDGVATPTSQDAGQTEFFGLPFEAMEEFKVQTSNPNAEYGSSLAVESYTMRSGTNKYHGDLYEFMRSDALNAIGQFYVPKKALLIMHELGGTFGGPLVIPRVYDGHNRTFFFVTAGDFRKSGQPPTQPVYTIPTMAERTGDFSPLLQSQNGALPLYDPATTAFDPAAGKYVRQPFSNNIIPTNRITSQSQYFLGLIATPNLPGTNGGIFSNYLDTNNSKLSDWTWSVKVDHSFNELHKIAGSYWQENNTSISHGPDAYNLLAFGQGTAISGGYRLHDFLTIRPNLLNDAFAGYSYQGNAGACDSRGITGNNPGKIPNLEAYNPGGAGGVGFVGSNGQNVTGAGGLQYFRSGAGVGGGCVEFISGSGKTAATRTYSIQAGDNLTFIYGKHEMKFGVVGTREFITYRRVGGASFFFADLETGLPGVGKSGDAFASFLLGQVDQVTASGPAISLGYQNHRAVLFAQDAWRVTPKLTINYGLRYEIPSVTREKHDRFGGFNAQAPNPAAGGIPGALVYLGDGTGRTGTSTFPGVHASRLEFSPRLGIAYALDSKTAIRFGYALMFTYGNATALGFDAGTAGWLPGIAQYSFNSRSSDNGVTPAMTLQGGLPAAPFSLPHYDPSYLNGASPFNWDPNSGLEPYMQQFTFSVQRYLPGHFFVDVTYLGQKGNRLTGNQDNWNQLPVSYMTTYGALLSQPFNSPAAIAAGIKAPYPGFTGSVGQALRPFPQYASITPRFDPSGMSWYNALQVQGKKQMGDLQLQVNFTQMKNLSNTRAGQFSNSGGTNVDTYHLALEKAPVRFESSRTMVLLWLYDLPVGRGKRFASGAHGALNQVIGGWQLGAIQTYKNGQNLFISGGVPNPIFNVSFRPNRLSGVPVRLSGCGNAGIGVGPLLNINAFASNSALQLGNAPPLLPERGCGWLGEDMNVQKNFTIKESTRLEFRSEFYNLFNRTKWADPSVNINSPSTFGRILGVDGRYQARTIQLGLKLLF